MSTLPRDFHFSQASLQDYVDCRRRFQLRYLVGLAWPAVEAEPGLENERRLQLGAAFHRLMQQHLLGLPTDRLSRAVAAGGTESEELPRWWDSFQEHGASLEGYAETTDLSIFPETSLTAPLGNGYRLVAKYDLLAIAPDGRAAIFDWKTYRKRPSRTWMEERLQTRVYPFLLALAGEHLNRGNPIKPDDVKMIYWYPEFPTEPERFAYSQAQFEQDGETLNALVREIAGLAEEDFSLTGFIERCRFCNYRSLCDRGAKAGGVDEIEAGEDEVEAAGADFGIDFEQIAEIEF